MSMSSAAISEAPVASSIPPRSPAPDAEKAWAALKWATDIARLDPSALESPPAKPSPADWRALSVPRVRELMDALLLGRHASEGLEALHRCGMLDVWLPEVAGLVGFGSGDWRHKDVWVHTKQVVKQSVPRLNVRWGALLHDIGKPRTRRVSPNGEVHFHGHAEVGAAMFRKRLAGRLGFEGELYERVHFLILQHLRGSQYDGSWTDSAVRRFYKEMGPGLDELLLLSRADITTKHRDKRRRALRYISGLAARVRALKLEDQREPALPKGLGNLFMERLGIPPSKRLGELRQALEDEVEQGTLLPRQPAEYYLEWLLSHRERFGL